MRKALITGVTGQDGSYLSEFLIEKGYEVHGVVRRSSSFNTNRIDHLINDNQYIDHFNFYHGDITDVSNINHLIEKIEPDEIYNLAAQSHVKVSFDMPDYTAQVDALGTLRILEAIRASGIKTKFYQASTSELFGLAQETPQKESTPFYPRSPYAIAKLFAYWTIVNYREAYNMYACNGILFNHESPRRGKTFVTRKITLAASRIKLGFQDILYLGNIDAKRDWGYAPDFVKGMWQMMQQKQPEDFVLATGVNHSIREFIVLVFQELDIQIEWKGNGEKEAGFDSKTGKKIIGIDKRYFRKTEVDSLLGDSTKAKKILGWTPKVSFKELIKIMVKNDFEKIKKRGY